jgi:hypothetical protein
MKRGRRFVLDTAKKKLMTKDITVDETLALAADVAARMAALRRQWEQSGDVNALAGALIFCRAQLPEWLFDGLIKNFEQQLKNIDAIRFLHVRYAHDALRKTMLEAYEWAAEKITDPDAAGRPDAMMKSYQKINRQVGEIDRIRPRLRARRRKK